MFCTRKLLNIRGFKRFLSTSSHPPNTLEHLKHRALIRVTGKESSEFLQGLITNDMNHLDGGVGCMYTMFLNTKGRVLYDTIIYKTFLDDMFYVECDSDGVDILSKHLKMYRVRRKVDIVSLKDEYNIYALFNIGNVSHVRRNKDTANLKGLEGAIVPCNVLSSELQESTNSLKVYKDLQIYQDPRVGLLGSRVIVAKCIDPKEQISEISRINPEPDSNCDYKWFRYNLGVGEGSIDHPPNSSFPLESNCDYLHGVSFHKGCYLGQELTARTHHTGVVRKRLMPLYFSKIPTKLPEGNTILHENNNLGKLRGIKGDVGLGLLRISKALELNEFSVGNGVAHTLKPSWWPIEAPKDRMQIGKV